jgi:hypothetical protein
MAIATTDHVINTAQCIMHVAVMSAVGVASLHTGEIVRWQLPVLFSFYFTSKYAVLSNKVFFGVLS